MPENAEKEKIEQWEVYNRYQKVRHSWLRVKAHLRKVTDSAYTRLSDNGIELLEVEEHKLLVEMRNLERQLR